MPQFSDKPFCVRGGEIIGNVPTIEDLAVYIKDYIKNDVYSSEWGTDVVNGATRKALYDIIQNLVEVTDILPIGTILMYDGIKIKNIQLRVVQIGDEPGDEISMPGWFVCNGLGGTPFMIDKFVRGGIIAQEMGGSDDAIVVEHIHVATQPEHMHNLKFSEAGTGTFNQPKTELGFTGAEWKPALIDGVAPTITVENAGVSGVDKNIPAYFEVIMIMKMS